MRELCGELAAVPNRTHVCGQTLPGGQDAVGELANEACPSARASPEPTCSGLCSDGGADRRDPLGLHRHAGEGERLDGPTNQEESNREGVNVIFYTSATRAQQCVEQG